MTQTNFLKRYKIKVRSLGLIGCIISAACLFAFSYYGSDQIRNLTAEGLRLSFNTVIPSVFPFLIISEIFTTLLINSLSGVKNRKIYLIATLFCGYLCGFPISAQVAERFYKSGIFSITDCEKSCAFGSLPSLPFCIGVIGNSMLGSKNFGLLIWMICASVGFAIIIIEPKVDNKTTFMDVIPRQRLCFVETVKRSIFAVLNISAFVTLFTVLSGFLKILIKSALIQTIIIPFIEITNACLILNKNLENSILKYPMISAACSLSGACVLCQILSIFENTDFSIVRYIKLKLLYSIVSLILTLIIVIIF